MITYFKTYISNSWVKIVVYMKIQGILFLLLVTFLKRKLGWDEVEVPLKSDCVSLNE